MRGAMQWNEPPSDYALIRLAGLYTQARIAGGEPPTPLMENAWHDFHARYLPVVRRFVLACGTRHNDRDDCVQMAWMQILLKLHRFRIEPDRGRFKTWLFKVVTNAVADFYRQQVHNVFPMVSNCDEFVGNSGNPEEVFRLAERADRFRLAVQELGHRVSPENFSLFLMRFIDRRPVSELAALFNLGSLQVKYRVYRTKKVFARILAHFGDVGFWFDRG